MRNPTTTQGENMSTTIQSSDLYLRIVSAQATIAGAAVTLASVGAPMNASIEGNRHQYYGAVEALHLAAADLERVAEAIERRDREATP